jgi:hypothetical protein|tara:strand:- start:2025 stop:2306 length:282 start_codon:yes stop_codon:yes gene_type:complete
MPDDFDREEDIPAKQQQKKPVEKPKPVSKEIIPQFYHAGGKPISKETIKEHAEKLGKCFASSPEVSSADFEPIISDVFGIPKIFKEMLFERIA